MRDLGRAVGLAIGAIGQPGQRTFLIEVTTLSKTYWFALEKEQAAGLAQQSLQFLKQLTAGTEAAAVDADELSTPDEITFRVASILLRLSDPLITVVLTPEGGDGVSFEVSPAQLAAASVRAIEVVGGGRPICTRCQLPEDPDDHQCPASNGRRV